MRTSVSLQLAPATDSPTPDVFNISGYVAKPIDLAMLTTEIGLFVSAPQWSRGMTIKVLAVDDEDDVRRLIAIKLNKAGFEVITAVKMAE